jgi:hypothetical protein
MIKLNKKKNKIKMCLIRRKQKQMDIHSKANSFVSRLFPETFNNT